MSLTRVVSSSCHLRNSPQSLLIKPSKLFSHIKWQIRPLGGLDQDSLSPSLDSYTLPLQTKYTILDERDIGLVHQYTFEPRLDVDRNGHGAKIFAVCYIYEKGRESGVLVQDLLWERHHGGIAPGFSVIHKNCVTVDNRMENLILVPSLMVSSWCRHPHHSTDILPPTDTKDGTRPDPETSLYFMAMQQLPFDPADEYVESLVLRYYDEQGQLVEEEDDSQCYYECRLVDQV